MNEEERDYTLKIDEEIEAEKKAKFEDKFPNQEDSFPNVVKQELPKFNSSGKDLPTRKKFEKKIKPPKIIRFGDFLLIMSYISVIIVGLSLISAVLTGLYILILVLVLILTLFVLYKQIIEKINNIPKLDELYKIVYKYYPYLVAIGSVLSLGSFAIFLSNKKYHGRTSRIVFSVISFILNIGLLILKFTILKEVN